jgi:hypothetical protein
MPSKGNSLAIRSNGSPYICRRIEVAGTVDARCTSHNFGTVLSRIGDQLPHLFELTWVREWSDLDFGAQPSPNFSAPVAEPNLSAKL